jgi:hypothetical protein
MISISDAFKKFKGRLELSDKEQSDASRRQNEIRELIRENFKLDRDILTGSYARWTKTKPLKDVDIFCILGEAEKHYRQKAPGIILEEFRKVLAKKYGDSCVEIHRRSVQVDFGVPVVDDDTEGKVMSFDVVPAFAKGEDFEIPDTQVPAGWIETNPEIHKELGTKANKAFSEEWKPLVKMIKKWNRTNGKPIKPGFLIEVMALELFVPPFSGGYPYELKSFFATAAERIGEIWDDPAKLGPPVSDQMYSFKIEEARKALRKAEEDVSRAIRFEKEGKNGDVLQEWRNLFGPLFPLS